MRRSCALALAGLLGLAGAGLSGDDEPAKVEEGKPAPDITLAAVNIGTVLPDKKDAPALSLKDLRGKHVVLYFFPKALTGG